MNFPIFDITDFKINSTSLIIDINNNEKYTLFKNILIHKSGNMEKCFIFTTCPEKFIKISNVIIYNNPSYLNEVIDKQILKHKKNTSRNILIIIDDLSMFDMKNIYLKEIFLNKTLKITCILNISNVIMLPSLIYNNLDFIFIYNKGNIKKIHEYYTNFFHSFNTFKEVYENLTPNTCLVIKKSFDTDIIYEKVSIYKI